ncbi:LPD7 domain-containing protein [Polaromonas sp. DSR2-3-2]|uniref:LPD7 domain-containing protein n=1 Tax=unclassified Polaromonas TaxID=2638319 RepID=UPI003CE74C5C
MIVEIGGGKGGLKEYLEHGKKKGRDLHRDQLDQRVVLFGDLDVFELATSTHGEDGHRYDHLTLSFSERHVTDDMLQIAVAEFRSHALAAWPEAERHRIAFYAEAHRPKILSYANAETGQTIERLTHIHIGLGKHDLLTGESIAPLGFLGMQTDNLKYIDAWQESFNARHGFGSPKDNPKITPQNAVDVLARYTGQRPDELGTFNSRKAALEVALQKAIIAQSITTWARFGQLLALHGAVSKMRAGQFGECYRIMLPGATRAMRLQGVFFQRQFIVRPTAEKVAIVSEKAKAAYLEQMQPRKAPQYVAQTLSEWHSFKARENRYLHTGSKFYKDVYLPADAATRQHLLDQLERNHHALPGPAAAPNRKTATARNRMPRMPTRNLDGIQERTEMLLRDHPSMDVPAAPRAPPDGTGVRQTNGAQGRNGGAGQQASPAGHERKRDRMIQPSSELARIHDDMRERYEQAADKERYTEIRRHLDCTQLLARLRHSHGLDAALYPVAMATDGTPRIACGTRCLTPSDFLTKEMGLPWREAAPILREVYALQIGKQVTRARDKTPSAQLSQGFKVAQVAENPDLALGAQAKTLAGLSGTARKSAPSLEKLGVAKVKAELTEKRLELLPSIPPFQAQARQLFPQSRAQAGSEEALAALRELENTARATPVQAAISGTIAFGNDQAEKKRRRRARESSAALLRALTHHVELNGDITYSKDGRAVFRDEGLRIVVLDQNDEDVIAAALLIAGEKFGQDLTLTGPLEFQQRVVAVAVARGIPVKFVDPALEALRLQLVDDKRQASAPAQTPLKVQDTGVDAAGLQQVAPVLLLETPSVDSQDEERYARLIAFAQDQGFNVERVVEGRQYLGKILQVTDEFVVHKVGRHTAVIHRVDQLQGSYTVGQTARIQYREGIGMDESEQPGSSGQER